jgi:hypothetical protein
VILLRVAVAVVVIALSCSPLPAEAQAVSPNASWSCLFASTPTGCGFYLQAAASARATLVVQARDGNNAVQLTTEPGDISLFGSGLNERADLELGASPSYCNQGQDEWWAHSLMFPSSYVIPVAGLTWNWGIVFDFHHTGSSGQPNFQIVSLPTGLELWIAGGPTVVNGPNDPGFYSVPIGTVMFNQWYDFVYHVKWSSASDGFFQAWLNGQQLLNYVGPTLYTGQSCYLKLANYHTPLGLSVSVIHDRIVRGTTLADVEISSSNPMPVPVPSVVGESQAAGSTAIANVGLVVGAVTHQSSSTVASGYVISESPAANTSVASGSAVNLVVSTGASSSGGSGGGTSGAGQSGGGGGGALTPFALLSLLIVAIARRWGAVVDAMPARRLRA